MVQLTQQTKRETMTIKIRYTDTGTHLKANGYTFEQEKEIYDAQLQDIIDNPREYLDGINHMAEYRVSWKDYREKTPTVPYKFVADKKNKKLYK